MRKITPVYGQKRTRTARDLQVKCERKEPFALKLRQQLRLQCVCIESYAAFGRVIQQR